MLEKVTRTQEAFDIVKAHLLTQMEKCLDDSYACMYRNQDGLKCAIGSLIPDSEYAIEFEYMPLPHVAQLCPSLKDLDVKFLRDLQNIHDAYLIEQWDSELNNLARKYNLCG